MSDHDRERVGVPSKAGSVAPDAAGGRTESDLLDRTRGAHAELVARVAALETENMKLRTNAEAQAAIEELMAQLRRLELERDEMQARMDQVSKDFGQRFAEFEQEFANLANLYVASSQLHSTMSPRTVTRRIKEILAQLVGAESYGVYLANAERTELVPIASEGIPADVLTPIGVDDGIVGRTFRSGDVSICEGDPSRGSFQEPAAVIPLSVDDGVVGVVAVFTTLVQKTEFESIDHELFHLLARHAAAALVSASLFVASGKKIPGLEAFIDLSV
ncbi:MAG: GAF domain-containing protein [Polyangiaceae bacterium]|nr:GAF domain-containing protein [Polyangiaceae bacterium]